MSYLLRHNPENLKVDEHGFASSEKLFEKIRERFQVSNELIFEIVEKSEKKRFEIIDDKIRALYGHTIPVRVELEEDIEVEVLYHGTTHESLSEILRIGLKSMKRKYVHLSPTIDIAEEVGSRRTETPVILKIDVETARKEGIKFFRATDKVYLCKDLPPKYISQI